MTPTLDVDPKADTEAGTPALGRLRDAAEPSHARRDALSVGMGVSDQTVSEDDDVLVGPMLLQGSVRVTDPRWVTLEPQTIAELVLSALAGSPVAPGGPASFDLLFTDDVEMTELNGRFRMKPVPTNVLAFPSGERCERGVPTFLGGVALSFDRVSAEAANRAISLTAHATHLVLHGLLHLLGYEHEDEIDRHEMERVEVWTLGGLGIANPYEGS